MKRFCITAAVFLEWMLTINYYLLHQWLGGALPFWGWVLLLLGFVGTSICRMEKRRYSHRLENLSFGSDILLMFYVGLLLELALTAAWLLHGPGVTLKSVLWHLGSVLVLGSAVFWNGMIRVYLCSVQLGLKWRLIGALCGWIPLVHLWALAVMIRITRREVQEEQEKAQLNEMRAESEICRTRYPVLMVHGVFFRDSRLLNYWGRIPAELKKNGACVFYGEHESAASVAVCGQQIADKIMEIRQQTGCEKVNLIAHSKGGLDCRYAISCTIAGAHVASLTTINTPHRGCLFAEQLLYQIAPRAQEAIARRYNQAARHLGDQQPDFLAAVKDLTVSACARMNEEMPNRPGVLYQSVGSRMNRASSGKFPLNMTYHLVKHYEKAGGNPQENDGLVTTESMRWGQEFTMVSTAKGRGVSHGDMIDLNRENIQGFDVREFYVRLLEKLKRKGV